MLQRFRPVTAETPKALLPLVNAPMIEYALEWLAANGVAKVHVLCCAHADAICAHLERSRKWAPERCAMAINTIRAYECRSAGDALRFMDQEGLISDDFVLLSCDSITNMDLGAALAAHGARRCAQRADFACTARRRRVQGAPVAPVTQRRSAAVQGVGQGGGDDDGGDGGRR